MIMCGSRRKQLQIHNLALTLTISHTHPEFDMVRLRISDSCAQYITHNGCLDGPTVHEGVV
jgi:hypothetical protein